jgi:RND family efflux transporter MFP subunit
VNQSDTGKIHEPGFRKLIKYLVPFLFLGAGTAAGWYCFGSMHPEIKKKHRTDHIVAVETIRPEYITCPRLIHALGTVMAERMIRLKPGISGKIVFVAHNFVKGRILEKGQVIVKIDDSDYKIQVKKAKSMLDKALADLAIEKGSQMIARKEAELVSQALGGEFTPGDLALRRPQFLKARAAVDRAAADLEKARLDLSRTIVRAPFNALVLEKQIDRGSFINPQETLATLVDVDTYKIEARVRPDHLKFLKPGTRGQNDTIIRFQYSDETRCGRIAGPGGTMAAGSRMPSVIILVDDPLGLNMMKGSQPLILNDYVELVMQGGVLENVIVIPESALRPGDIVWACPGNRLELKKVHVAWKQNSRVFIDRGLNPGDPVIVSELSAAVQGMVVQPVSGKMP